MDYEEPEDCKLGQIIVLRDEIRKQLGDRGYLIDDYLNLLSEEIMPVSPMETVGLGVFAFHTATDLNDLNESIEKYFSDESRLDLSAGNSLWHEIAEISGVEMMNEFDKAVRELYLPFSKRKLFQLGFVSEMAKQYTLNNSENDREPVTSALKGFLKDYFNEHS